MNQIKLINHNAPLGMMAFAMLLVFLVVCGAVENQAASPEASAPVPISVRKPPFNGSIFGKRSVQPNNNNNLRHGQTFEDIIRDHLIQVSAAANSDKQQQQQQQYSSHTTQSNSASLPENLSQIEALEDLLQKQLALRRTNAINHCLAQYQQGSMVNTLCIELLANEFQNGGVRRSFLNEENWLSQLLLKR